MRLHPALSLPLWLVASLSFSQDLTVSPHHVAGVIPVASPQRELAANRSQAPDAKIAQPETGGLQPQSNNWKLLATLPGVIHAISFANTKVGYAVGEQGVVFKTTNGGKKWVQQTLSDAASDYFYGVNVFSSEKVVISGFYDSSTAYGVFRWTENGGRTWSNDVSPGPEWLQQVHFATAENGIIMPLGPSGSNPETTAEYTTNGGAALSDWKNVVANPSGAWFDPQFSFLTNLHARASGINFCTSLKGGSRWKCAPSVDSVFDGPVFFLNDSEGWVGGGEIAPNVEGWMHVTTNGGKTWSGRTLDGPWPIRSILFLTSKVGWAGGGNIYSNVGGIYFTADGGNTWTVDATTNSEMGSCTEQPLTGGHYQLWCAGFNSSSGYASVIYSTQY